ncbi:MAG: hypothetical protein NUV50_10800 [Rhodospirillales bacterium]|nr:hypothetical protein [Rhodospirillales bacterium]
MHVQIVCDQKWRDLPTICALKLSLETHGVRVTVASSKETYPLLPLLQPDAVVFNHMYSRKHQEIAAKLRLRGVANIVMPTEGKGEPAVDRMTWGDFNDFSSIDLYLSWNERTAKNLVKSKHLPADRVKVVGCTRYDFYQKPWNKIVESRESFCQRYGLDAQKSIVTWTTKFGYAQIYGDAEAQQSFEKSTLFHNVHKCYEAVGLDWHNLPKIHHDNRIEQAERFFRVAVARPDIQFLIKPHPTETWAFYEQLIDSNGLSNVTLVSNEYIWDVLNATDVLFQQRCLTALEAWLMGKPSIEMKMNDREQLAWPEYEVGSHQADGPKQMLSLMDTFLVNGERPSLEMLEKRKLIAQDFAWKVDGKRSAAAAKAILEFLKLRAPHKRIRARDVGCPWSTVLRVGVRYAMGLKNTQSIIEGLRGVKPRYSKSVADQLDKEISSKDVEAYCAKIRQFF